MEESSVISKDLTISIVILTYNRSESLYGCLKAILANTEDLSKICEIIIVDNHSDQPSQTVIDRFKKNQRYNLFKVIRLDKNYGVWARNYGFKEAKGNLICQIDDDSFVMSYWDSQILKHFDDEKVIAVGPAPSKITGWLAWNSENIKPGDEVDVLCGYCWMFRNKGFLYDDYYIGKTGWHEESDLALEMKSAGYKLKACESNCYHMGLRKEIDWTEHSAAQKWFINKWRPRWEAEEFELIGINRR